MASPFAVFRRNQKILIAVLGILTMFAFVFLPTLQELIGGRAAVNKVVVTTSKFGHLRESDVDALRRQRQKVLSVLADVMQMSGAPAGLVQQWLEARIGPATEEAAVNSWLLANHARQLGMVISDQTVNNFLKELTQNSVKPTNFQTAFKRSGISERQFFSAMRDELAALQIDNLFRISLMGITPAERWDYFNRVKQTAMIEALAVPVANFTDKVDAPSDAELQTFFENNKDKFANPRSSEAGFREPQRVALDYVKADVEKFLAPTIVTDAEIKERYEKNKDRYDPKPEEKKSEEKKSEEKKSEEKKPEDKKPEGKDSKAPAKDAKAPEPAKENAPADKKDSKDSKEPVKTEKKDEKKTSSVDTDSPFRLTSYLEDAKPAEKPAEPAKPAEKPAEKPATPPAQEKPAEKPATPATPAAPAAQEKPAEKPAAPATPEKPAAPAAQEKPAAPAAQEKPAEPKTGLTDSTKNRIRREIAYEKIQKLFLALREQLDPYREKRQQYDAQLIRSKTNEKEKESLGPPPAKPDIEKFAKDNGLASGSTPLLSQWQAQESDIGSSLVGGRDPVYSYAYQSMPKFRPEISYDLKGDLYLFWKTDEAKERIPKFEDEGVREQVLRAWKLEHARDLAFKQAEATADEARKAKKHLKQVFPDRQIIMPPPFSWITFGNVPMGSAPNAARISNVTGVDYAGDAFMQTTFRLKPGEVGVAFNEPKTVAYVIRLTALDPSQDVLWKEFEVDDFNKYAPAAQSDRRQMMQGWLDEVKKSAGFELAPGYKFDRTGESSSRGQQ